MNVRKLTKELHGASNVLVLAPLTPAGNQACMELLSSTPSGGTRFATVTYTQPPEQWIADWRTNIGDLPAEARFIYAGGMSGSDSYDEETPANVTTSVVDPTDPMEIIVPLSTYLEEWTEKDDRPIVAVQTLTVLLEYVDFDTAFRYLHILTHRVQAAGAVGYYQMDPDIHDPETVNTLKTLFDAVVKVTDDGSEWTTTPTFESETLAVDEEPERASDGAERESDGPLSSIRTAISGLFERDSSDELDGSEQTRVDERGGDTEVEDEPGVEAEPDVGNLVDEEMLTDEERIRSLLLKYGGRMKQADITAETSWSKSTVSRKLSKMEENDEITRVQIGRGNLVFLNGSEPEASKSPFEA